MAGGSGGRHRSVAASGTGTPGLADPSRNVLDLVDAAVLRLDGLREMEARHVREMMSLRADYDALLRRAETARIDAIRAVDTGAVSRAAEVANERANTLALQGRQVEETLRVQNAQSISGVLTTIDQRITPLVTAIAELQKTQYELAGQRVQVAESKDDRRDSGMGARAWIAIALAAGGVLSSVMLGAAGIVITLVLKG